MRVAPPMLVAACAACGAQVGAPAAMPPQSGKGDGPGGDPPAAITATEYLDAMAESECREAYACQSMFPTNLGYTFADEWSTSLQACFDLVEADWKPATMESEIANGRIVFDGVAAAECVDNLAYGDCTDFFHSGPHWSAPCYQIVMPQVPLGGACQLDSSCKVGHCDATTSVCTM